MAYFKNIDRFGNEQLVNLAPLGTAILVNRTADYTTGGRSLAQYPFNNQARYMGTAGLLSLSGGGVLAQPGYRYRVSIRLQYLTVIGPNAWTSYMLRVGGVAINGSYYMKHGGYDSTGNLNGTQWYMQDFFEIPVGGAAQLVTLSNYDGLSTSTYTFENFSDMLVEVVGIL